MTRRSLVGRGAWVTAVALMTTGLPVFTARATSGLSSDGKSVVTGGVADSAEIALALTAAPPGLTGGADVYAWQGGHFVKARTGSTGVACMVSRDPRANGVFPMCFDPEAARTQMPEEMMRTELRTKGLSNTEIDRQVEAAFARGTLHHPTGPAIIYMMSSQQMLVDYKADDSRLIGAWRPHVMIYLPHTSTGQFALGAENETGPVFTPFVDAGGVQLVVQVPHWADTSAPPDGSTLRSGTGGP
jgi:hypothetical protein